jgi:hypothetical protein
MCFTKNSFSILICSLIILICLLNCKQEARKDKIESILPTLPVEEIRSLLANADATDFIFHNLPFSVNQSDLQSVRTTVSGIGIEPVYNADCPALGRMFVQVKGEIVMEAEIYYDGLSCHHYVFYQDKKPVYANQMQSNAIGFYNDLINSINNQK